MEAFYRSVFFLICQSFHEYCHKLSPLNMNTAMLLKGCCSEGLVQCLLKTIVVLPLISWLLDQAWNTRGSFVACFGIKSQLFFLSTNTRKGLFSPSPINYFSFKNELFYLLKGKRSALMHSCFVWTPISLIPVTGHFVQVCMSSGYHKWCISRLDLILDVLLVDSTGKLVI